LSEASRLGAEHRVFLEVAWEAIENAGYSPEALAAARTGVFVGAMRGGARLAGLLAYLLNLRGPALVVDTACSSSLVAVHLAVEALRRGECEFALAGGVHVLDVPTAFDGAAELGLLSSRGQCRAFDVSADGIVLGEGCGVVVLRRLEDALEARDRVVATIRGSAVNQDGRSTSLFAPNASAQSDVIRAALDRARLSPHEIDYLEAHGTGTRLGDLIEMRTARDVYGPGREGPLLIGSVKTNIGHTQSAAGVAGLIKAAL
jgi:acyl transferase domain-containing protein